MKIGVHLTIDEDLLKKIDHKAKAEKRSRSSMANLILEAYFFNISPITRFDRGERR